MPNFSVFYRKTRLFLAIALIFTAFSFVFRPAPASAGGKKTKKYVLGIGDKIEVLVWRNEDLSKEVVIRPDGKLSLPLAGEIKAEGITPVQLGEKISSKLSRYIKEPRISVIVNSFGSRKILVLGQVNQPGVYNMPGPLTALEAIAKAEGHKEFAYLKKVMVIRKAYSDKPEIIPANLLDVISGRKIDAVQLMPGDIVYVPKKFVGKLKDFLSFFNSNVKPIADSYINYRDSDND